MKPTLLVAALLLAGCGVDVSPADIKHAERLCADNEGWSQIETTKIVDHRRKVAAFCRDGTRFTRDGK